MNEDDTGTPLPLTARAAAELEAWYELRDRLQALHARLEYVRLMLKLAAPRARAAAGLDATAQGHSSE